ncbi:DUF3520 domain-containing protein, partial [Salmonella enterica subsp. enterica serovar Lubbock]|nr:DUF3520 domain-containing protein [Salmonella enterica subsp. enterica serovar Lubbock]
KLRGSETLADTTWPQIIKWGEQARGKDKQGYRAEFIKLVKLAQEAEAEGKPISEKIALVLTDLEMPEMDGFTLTRKIKTDER